ncbi:uncharacterized protein PSFLO_04898 [Pseudozyma flocculosa]|uniref:Uncharacterized protein n=1 Tax=Pseudozyma flocculosa TaxID=84751 RepID=A0A5C3F6T7_9BASI|nr:uncharacterized protein PSFLO_04898 [Pseudozyma flocculosa]
MTPASQHIAVPPIRAFDPPPPPLVVGKAPKPEVHCPPPRNSPYLEASDQAAAPSSKEDKVSSNVRSGKQVDDQSVVWPSSRAGRGGAPHSCGPEAVWLLGCKLTIPASAYVLRRPTKKAACHARCLFERDADEDLFKQRRASPGQEGQLASDRRGDVGHRPLSKRPGGEGRRMASRAGSTAAGTKHRAKDGRQTMAGREGRTCRCCDLVGAQAKRANYSWQAGARGGPCPAMACRAKARFRNSPCFFRAEARPRAISSPVGGSAVRRLCLPACPAECRSLLALLPSRRPLPTISIPLDRPADLLLLVLFPPLPAKGEPAAAYCTRRSGVVYSK